MVDNVALAAPSNTSAVMPAAFIWATMYMAKLTTMSSGTPTRTMASESRQLIKSVMVVVADAITRSATRIDAKGPTTAPAKSAREWLEYQLCRRSPLPRAAPARAPCPPPPRTAPRAGRPRPSRHRRAEDLVELGAHALALAHDLGAQLRPRARSACPRRAGSGPAARPGARVGLTVVDLLQAELEGAQEAVGIDEVGDRVTWRSPEVTMMRSSTA